MSLTFKKQHDFGIIEFDQDDSKVNLLTAENIKRLDVLLDEVKVKKDISALLIVSKKKDVFIAGADIKEIEDITDPLDGQAKAKAGQDVLNKLEDLPMPTIAVIDGVALGGGCELLLACKFRMATCNSKVRIGLPEVNLGFVPGFGGTWRLPRLVGFSEGLTMILTGKPISGNKALKIGLVDRIVTEKGLDQHILDFMADVHRGKKLKNRFPRKKKKGFLGFLDHSLIGQAIVVSQARKNVLKTTKGFYPAPLRAIDLIKETFYMTNRRKVMDMESAAFGKLAVTDISKNCVKVFYLSEEYKKLTCEGADDIVPQSIDKCAVLGAGIMGGGIAQLFSAKNIWVRLKDINLDAVAKGFQAASKVFHSATKRRRLTKAQATLKMAHITGTLDYSGFKNVNLVIEAVVENMDLKKKVFKELSEVTGKDTILATNTSALSVTEMASQTKDPSKVIGIHFFNPVHRMPLVEVITTPQTSKETIVTTLKLIKQLGKTPILVKDSCGFIVNRILLAYINEAGRLLEECGGMERIDKIMTDFGMPMGPLLLSDEVGLDVGVKVLHILEQGLGERFKAVDIFEKVYAKGLLGKKSGSGFYIHGKKRVPNEKIFGMLKVHGSGELNANECRQRLVYVMINEAAQCLEEKLVDKSSAIDAGMIFGTGFPPFRGGLLRYADSVGIENIIASLEYFAKELHADRFKPCDYLLKLRETGSSFFN